MDEKDPGGDNEAEEPPGEIDPQLGKEKAPQIGDENAHQTIEKQPEDAEEEPEVEDNHNKVHRKHKKAKKDYWRSWAVLVAGTCMYTISYGVLSSFGIYVTTLLAYFKASRTEINLIGSIGYGCMCMIGPFVSVPYQLIGCRLTSLFGVILAVIGYIIAHSANSPAGLTVCYAFIGTALGIGVGPVTAAQTEYFEKYQYFAVTFVTVGSAIGLLAWSPLLEYVLEKYGWQNAMLFNAATATQLLVAAMVMRSTKRKETVERIKVEHLFYLELVKHKRFVLLCAAAGLWGAAYFVYLIILPGFMDSRGIEKKTAAVLMSVGGGGSLIGRLTSAFANLQPKMDRLLLITGALSFGTIQIWLTLACKDIIGFGIVGFLFGFGFGALQTSLQSVLVELFGAKRVTGSRGFIGMFIGFGALVSPFIAGSLIDNFGQESAIIFDGIVGTTASVLCVTLLLWSRIQPIKHSVKGSESQDSLEDDYTESLEELIR